MTGLPWDHPDADPIADIEVAVRDFSQLPTPVHPQVYVVSDTLRTHLAAEIAKRGVHVLADYGLPIDIMDRLVVETPHPQTIDALAYEVWPVETEKLVGGKAYAKPPATFDNRHARRRDKAKARRRR